MSFVKKIINDIIVLELKGRLDVNTSSELEDKSVSLIDENNKKMLIDFAELEYISSAGLRVLLLVAKKIEKKNGKIVLCSMKNFTKEIFEISGFTTIFTILSKQKKAIKELA